MTVPSGADILALLDDLDRGKTADDLESLWLDFKPWHDARAEMRLAVEYAACFANADGGVVVFGVDDKAAGRSKAVHGVGPYNPDLWRRTIYDGTRPNLSVELEELPVPEGTGTLLIMRVAKGVSPPYGTSQGLFKKRVGKNCMPLDPQSFLSARVSTGAVDWSGQPAEGVVLGDLDPVEISRGRALLRKANPESPLLGVRDDEFLVGLGVVRRGKLTHAGLLLFGRADMIADLVPQHQVHYVYQTSPIAVSRNESLRAGLLNVLEQVERFFTGPVNPEHEVSVGLLKLRIPAFPLDAVREAVLNAVTHRDYLDTNDVLLRHSASELVVTSPGGFLANITPRNILRAEPISRNRTLAEAFEKLRLVERAGTGRLRIFIPALSYGKRLPEYETDGSRVTLRVFDGSFDERMARLVADWRAKGRGITLDALLILDFLRAHAFIDTLSASEVLQLPRAATRGMLDQLALPRSGILERRGGTAAATFHLTKAVAHDLLGKAAYSKIKGIDPIRYPEMVKAFVADFGSITPEECRELLGLGESQTARVQVSRLLRRWSNPDGFLRREGNPPKVRYFPVAER